MLINFRAAIALSIALFSSLDCVRTPAIAQEAECFMVTSSGKFMNLSALCRGNSAQANSLFVKEVFQAPIKRRKHGIPVIDVTFNGTQTFEMFVDTGASKTVLTPQMAAALRIAPIGKAKVDTSSDKGVDMFFGRMASIEAAGAVVRNTLVGVSPALDTGLLGEDFFSRYEVVIKENVVEFRSQQL